MFLLLLCMSAFSFFFHFYLFILFYFIFKLYIIVLVLPNIKMNQPQVYMCSPSWTLLPPPSPFHPSGSSQCTRPKHPVKFWYEMIFLRQFIHSFKWSDIKQRLILSIRFNSGFSSIHIHKTFSFKIYKTRPSQQFLHPVKNYKEFRHSR